MISLIIYCLNFIQRDGDSTSKAGLKMAANSLTVARAMLENELADICLCEGKKNKISKSSNKRET